MSPNSLQKLFSIVAIFAHFKCTSKVHCKSANHKDSTDILVALKSTLEHVLNRNTSLNCRQRLKKLRIFEKKFEVRLSLFAEEVI